MRVVCGVYFALDTFICWINVSEIKSGATCYVQSFYVPALNKTTGNYTTGNTTNVNFVMSFVNPYESVGIHYDDLNFTFYYGSNQSLQIGSYMDVGFYQSPQDTAYDTTHLRDSFETAQGMPWGTVPKNGSAVAFRVDLATRVRYSESFFQGKWRMFQVRAVVEVNDTTGLKIKKRSTQLKSGSPKLRHSGAQVRLLMLLLAGSLCDILSDLCHVFLF